MDMYHYHLADLTQERMEELIGVMAHYPQALSDPDRGYHNTNIFIEQKYAATLLGEALLRFPDHDHATAWQWQRAKHLFIAGLAEAKDAFIELILDALNRQEIDLAGLPAWFVEHEPEMELSVRALSPLPDYQGSFIILIKDWSNGFYI